MDVGSSEHLLLILTYFFSIVLSFPSAGLLGDHDPVLLALATAIGDFVPYIGGANHANLLLPILESLCSCEESSVRNAAAGSVSKILTFLSTGSTSSTGSGAAEFEPNFVSIMAYWSFIRQQASSDTGEVFYPRYTMACCLPALYRAIHKCEGMAVPPMNEPASRPVTEPTEGEDAEKEPLGAENYESVEALKLAVRNQYQALLSDEISIVRTACVVHFMNMTDSVEPELVPSVMLQMLCTALKDDCSPIRVRTIGHLAAYTDKLKELGVKSVLATEVVPIVRACVTDDSWRIRRAIALPYSSFASSFEPAEVTSDLFPLLMQLVHDSEPDVRQAVLPQLVSFLEVVGTSVFLAGFMPIAEHLVEDPAPLVRKLLASLVVDVISNIQGGSEVAHDLVVRLLGDEDPMIRLRVLQKYRLLVAAVPELCTKLNDSFKSQFTDSNWRVRSEMTCSMPAVITSLGIPYFEENFMAEFLGMLRDSVDDVRVEAAKTLSLVAPRVGVDFTYDKIFPSVRSMCKADFLLRLSMLAALEGLIKADWMCPENFQSECLALVVAATNDRVPNVRLKAAQVLSSACAIVGPDISRDHIRPVLNDLQGDADRDVAYFATEGMKFCA